MAELTLVTREQLLAELTEIAEKAREENGGVDVVYARPHADVSGFCLYVHDAHTGNPTTGCLFGRWAHEKRGIPLAKLAERNSASVNDLALYRPELGLEGDVLKLARAIQRQQDNQVPWLEAIQRGTAQFDTRRADRERGSE